MLAEGAVWSASQGAASVLSGCSGMGQWVWDNAKNQSPGNGLRFAVASASLFRIMFRLIWTGAAGTL